MRTPFWLSIACLIVAAGARAETPLCADCLLGVFDDQAMTRTSGTASSFQTKSVYLGVRFGSQVSGLVSLEFDAAYPTGFIFIDFTAFVPNAEITPVSNSRVRIEWTQCVRGDQALFRIRFLSFWSVQDAVVRVRDAELETCSGAALVRIPGGCYVLNPSGRVTACGTPREPVPWTIIKGLFR